MITEQTANRILKPQFDHIPDELKELDQWLVWSIKPHPETPGDYIKPPKNPATGGGAGKKDAANWSTYDVVRQHYQAGHCDGIGFVVTADQGIVFVDFDGVRDPDTGEIIVPEVRQIIADADSYTEVSCSGTGIHILVRGRKPAGWTKQKPTAADGTQYAIEVYDNHPIYLTGHLIGDENDIVNNQAVIDRVHKLWGPEPTSPAVTLPAAEPLNVDAQAIVDKIRRSRNAAKIVSLLEGSTDAHGDDASSADQGLCNHLAFWCDRDPQRMDEIFRASGLMRDKWDTVHSSEGLTYGEMTIRRAIEGCSTIYGWEKRKRKQAKPKGEPQVLSDPQEEGPHELEFGPPIETFYADESTDRKNAELLIELHGRDIRYCPPLKSWFIFDGKCWKRDDSNQIIRRAHAVADYFWAKSYEIVDEEQKAACQRHAVRSANTQPILNFLKQAQVMVPIDVDELNAKPWLFNCENGTIDLRTGKLCPHRRGDFLTVMCPTTFDPDAPSLTWDSFLESTFADHGDVIPFLQRLLGSALVGMVRDHILPIFFGSGSNGKSVLINAILHTLGRMYGMQAVPDMLMDTNGEKHPTERADLFGMRFVAAIETEAYRKLKESMVKSLTGGDRIRARHLYKDFFEFDPSHLIVLCTNHRPKVYGDDYGIWRRLRLIPFDQTFTGDNCDPLLTEKLQDERSGILAWMVKGCLDWQAQGLNEPQTVLQATDGYRNESDVIGQFLNDACYVGSDQFKVKFADLFEAFEAWCHDAGENVPSKHRIGKILNERFDQVPNVRGRWYSGIGLKDIES
jgi:putative DNA primase/helicase